MADYVVEVTERFAPGLTGRIDREYAAPPQPRDAALALVALLLDAPVPPAGGGPWTRALAGGRRTVRLVAVDGSRPGDGADGRERP